MFFKHNFSSPRWGFSIFPWCPLIGVRLCPVTCTGILTSQDLDVPGRDTVTMAVGRSDNNIKNKYLVAKESHVSKQTTNIFRDFARSRQNLSFFTSHFQSSRTLPNNEQIQRSYFKAFYSLFQE